MKIVLSGRIQPGKNDASRWLGKFNEAYSRKLGMPVFPGSLNLALNENFDWFAPRWEPSIVWFGMDEYGGERDILLLPCRLPGQENRRAFLWTPTTAARERPDPWVVELVTNVGLRQTYNLQDGDVVAVVIDG
jgi:CTP-dependent riboflavin kinase